MSVSVLDRLKFELNKKPYFDNDLDYITLLEENGLDELGVYDKTTMQRKLLQTVVDVLEIVSNDIDILRRVETEFLTTESASEHLRQRIKDLNIKINSLPEDTTSTTENNFSNRDYFFGSRW